MQDIKKMGDETQDKKNGQMRRETKKNGETRWETRKSGETRRTLGILCAKVGSIQVQPIAYSVIHIRTRLELRKKDMTERRSTLLIYC
jgi:hypothetical protein